MNSKLKQRKQQRKFSSSGKQSRARTTQPQYKPLSVLQRGSLQRGNSDPFNSAGITITPQVNQVLGFARDICLPAFYFDDVLRDSSGATQYSRDVTNSSGWISSPAARDGWEVILDALSDKCTALACLSSWLSLMAACNINPVKAHETSLKMRAGGSALLRQSLIQLNSDTTPDPAKLSVFIWQVFWLFYGEFFAGNMSAAQIHGQMLRQACEKAGREIVTDHLLDSIVFVDSNMSAKYMVRTVLDIDHWVPEVFAPIWTKIDNNIPAITGEYGENLHPLVSSEPLRTIFIRTRQSLILLRQSSQTDSSDIDFATLYYWLNSHAYVDGGILIHKYLDMMEADMSLTNPPPAQPRYAVYTRASLCLAALYMIRDLGHELKVNGISIVDASSSITQHLKAALAQAHALMPTSEHRLRSAHLWCAYVGALDEQREHLILDHAEKDTPAPVLRDAAGMYFNHLFAELAQSMGLLSWQQVADVLKQFIYTDAAEPHGSRWFWKTMGAYLDTQRKTVLTDRRTSVSSASSQGSSQPSVGQKRRSVQQVNPNFDLEPAAGAQKMRRKASATSATKSGSGSDLARTPSQGQTPSQRGYSIAPRRMSSVGQQQQQQQPQQKKKKG